MVRLPEKTAGENPEFEKQTADAANTQIILKPTIANTVSTCSISKNDMCTRQLTKKVKSCNKSIKGTKETSPEPAASEWLTSRRIHKTYSRSKRVITNLRGMQEIGCKREQRRNILEEVEKTAEHIDFLTSHDTLLSMKEEIVDECEDNNIFVMYDTHEKGNISIGTMEDIRQNIYIVEVIKEEQEAAQGETVNEYDEKITVEYNTLDQNNLQVVGETVELQKPKEEKIIGTVEETQSTSTNHEAGDANGREQTSYKCTVCLKGLNVQQSLKIHMVVHKNKKNVYCEHCFKSFARDRNLLEPTITQGFVQKKILRRDLHSHVTDGVELDFKQG